MVRIENNPKCSATYSYDARGLVTYILSDISRLARQVNQYIN